MKYHYILLSSFLIFTIVSCKDGFKDPSLDPKPIVETSGDKTRSSWQKPQEVIDLLDSLDGKTVIDVGAGTGYFTFRIAFKASKVIALDIDPNMIDLLETFKANLPTEIQSKIDTRLVPPDDPKLSPNEGDAAIIINTIAYISNKIGYLQKLRLGLKPNSKLIIVDFKTIHLLINAPSMDQRYDVKMLKSDLEKAGYHEIKINEELLNHQYVIQALS